MPVDWIQIVDAVVREGVFHSIPRNTLHFQTSMVKDYLLLSDTCRLQDQLDFQAVKRQAHAYEKAGKKSQTSKQTTERCHGCTSSQMIRGPS
jgi:hypothetical protein